VGALPQSKPPLWKALVKATLVGSQGRLEGVAFALAFKSNWSEGRDKPASYRFTHLAMLNER